MKKKIVILCAMLLLLSVFSLVLTGCGRKEDVTSIAFEQRPASTYMVGGSLSFSLKVTLDGGKEETISYPDNKSITVTGFSTAAAGTYTATVSYDAYSLEFTYSVYDSESEFAGGTGSAQEPYLIASATQFQNMLKKTNAKYYYKLIADIDFSGVTIRQAARDGSDDYFSAVIDGNGYRLLNIDNVVTAEGSVSKMTEIFGQVGDFTLRNIEVNFAATGEYSATGLVTSGISGSEILFENVTTTGFIDANNSANTSIGVYVMQAFRREGASVTFRNCVNETDILNSTMSMYVSGFTNMQSNPEGGAILFDNCVNSATIEGANSAAAGFLTFSKVLEDGWLSFTNGCKNTGVIIRTTSGDCGAGQIGASSNADAFAAAQTVLAGAGAEGTLDTSVALIEATLTGGTVSFTYTGSADVSYFRVIHIGSVTYKLLTDSEKNPTGTLFYYEQLASDADSYTLKSLYWSNTRVEDGSRAYGNPNIVLKDGAFYYDDTVLAEGCEGPKSVIIFAYNEDGRAIGVSAQLTIPAEK